MKRKIVAIIIVAAICAGGIATYKSGILEKVGAKTGDTSEVYVIPLSDIMGANSSYSTNVFMGVVEGQESTSLTKSSERELDQVFVSEGDFVDVGTPLFSYKSDKLLADNTQLSFDIERSNLEIKDYNDNIAKNQAELEKIKTDTEEDKNTKERLNNEINGWTTDIAMAENSIAQTQAKIDENNRKINNSTVSSTVAGVITKIADDTNPYTTDGSFITILASKEMRVKGQINEQNVWAINVDEPVTLRSRVNKDQTWHGTITKIDTESKQEDSNNYGESSNENSSTKYPFYVTLEDSEGLMMGQHLYIELGQTDAEEMDFSDGTYIYEYYLAYDEEGNPFLWVDNGGKLAKQPVELGDYYEEQMVYSVTGIDKDTKVAYPMEDLTEGMQTVGEIQGE